MTKDTDETARTILEWADVRGQTIGEVESLLPSRDLIPMARFWLMREEIAMALDRSRVAIDDWLNVDFADFCDEERVIEAQQRINEFGTVAYIADVQQQSRDLLKRIAEVENGE